MNIKLTTILLFIFVASSSVLLRGQGNQNAYTTTWQKNAFGDNWFVSFGSGAQLLMGEDDSKASFTSRITYAPSLTVGKYFSPLFGLRVNMTGGSLHGFNDGLNGTYSKWNKNGNGYMGEGYVGTPGYPTAGPNTQFLTWDPSWNYRGFELNREIGVTSDGSYFWIPGHPDAGGALYMQHVRYMAVSANAMIDLVTLFRGYNPRHVFNLTPFVGPTLFYTFAHQGNDGYLNFGLNAGLNARFSLNQYIDFFVEGSAYLYPDDFDGHMGGQKGDLVVQGVGGITFKLGKQYWERCDHADYDLIARLNDEINRLRNKPCCPLIEPKKPIPDLLASYILPARETVKKREISDEAYLIFQVNKTELRQDLGNNVSELAKITKSIDFVREESDVTVDRIFITGYASPEGNEQGNIRLSEGRSKAVKDYVRILYRFDDNLFSVRSNGENWDGLVKALEKTSLTEQEKLDITDIITMTSNVSTRKSRLQSYKGGRPYQYLLKEIYPGLRRTDYKIEFTVPEFTVERGKQLINTKPQMLSQYEMYQIAHSYPKGSPEFARALETALTLYPNDPVANVNASAIALERNELERASSYLEGRKSDPQVFNNLGILYALQGKEQEAVMYFKLAVENGSEEAAKNLEVMAGFQEKLDQYNEEMEQYLELLEQVRTDE